MRLCGRASLAMPRFPPTSEAMLALVSHRPELRPLVLVRIKIAAAMPYHANAWASCPAELASTPRP